MLTVNEIEVWGFKHAIRGMRNPMNSWAKSDSTANNIGKADLTLMRNLYAAGTEHRKYLRQIFVSMDIVAPLYWWKEFDTYKIGVTANSCSTMHKITSKPIEVSDFSMDDFYIIDEGIDLKDCFINVVTDCEMLRMKYLETKDKKYWKGLIQLLPSSYNQKRTITMNYENVCNIIQQRSGNKLDEWQNFVAVLKKLPYVYEIMKGSEGDE